MNNIILNDDIRKIIDEAVEKTVKELRNKNMIKESNNYKKTELMLYNYNNFLDAIKQKEEDIEYIKRHGLPQKSMSIVINSGSCGSSTQDKYLALIEKYELEKKEIERNITRINNALLKLKNDKYYKIVELKYLGEDRTLSDEELASMLSRDRTTISRNRKRLIKRLSTILFSYNVFE
ncbi:MAG: hypothetical protein HUJ88_11580 [Fusobacterium necrophorum]|nr:hypothetical protein [Fusobacterium necrophorum]